MKTFLKNICSALLCILATGAFINATAQKTVTFSQPNSGKWVVPTGVTSIAMEVWGAGGGGGSVAGNKPGAGGGGGAYAGKTLTVTPGDSIYFVVGSGGIGAMGLRAGENGGLSSFGILSADGGFAATGNIAGAGAAAGSTGNINHSGASGGNAADVSDNGGGGGGASGNSGADGLPGSSNAGATGGSGGIGADGGGSGGKGHDDDGGAQMVAATMMLPHAKKMADRNTWFVPTQVVLQMRTNFSAPMSRQEYTFTV